MGISALRVLVVDDFEPFRQFVCGMLRNKVKLQLVYEASDGAEAVEQANRWQPDMILLDIGLPTLNGFQAAAQIRHLVPKSKILFLSEESSPEIVREALALGSSAYIVKCDAGTELLTALEAVFQGKTFIGSRFAAQDFAAGFETGSP